MGPFVLRSESVSSTVDYLLGSIQDLMEYSIRCEIEAPKEVATKAYSRLAKKAYSRNAPGAKLTAEPRNGWAVRSRPTATDPGRTQKRGKVIFLAQQLSFLLIC